MGHTPSGRGPLPPDLGERLRSLERYVQHVDRKFSDLKIPPASSGGPVGMAEVYSTDGTVTALAGAEFMDYTAVTYQAPYDPNAGTDAAASISWLSINGYELSLEPGYYIPVMHLRLQWTADADAPGSFGGYMGGGQDSAHNDVSFLEKAQTDATFWGIYHWFNFGPTYIGPGATLHAECRFGSSPAADMDATTSNIGWTITKLT